LEKLVHIYFSSDQPLRRYLTLFYGFTLGLALVLAFLAVVQRVNVPPGAATVTQAVISQTIAPIQASTQNHADSTSTPIPAIPSTPNVKIPSALGLTADQLRGLQVSLWHPWTGSMGAVLQSLLDEFNRTNQWGVTIQASAYEGFGRLDEAVEAALVSTQASDSLPEVLIDYGYQARHWDDNNVLVDLTPYVTDSVWGFAGEEEADFYPAFWEEDLATNSSSGKTRRLGIPFYRSAYVLFYNQTWAGELGYPTPPVTLEDFRVRACAAAESFVEQGDKSNPGRGGWLVTPQPGAAVGWIYAFGGNISRPSGQGYLFNTPETEQAFEYLKDLQASGCAWSDTGVNPQIEFAERQALFVVGSLFDIPNQQQVFDQENSKDDWLVIPFPSNTEPVVDTYGPSLLLTHSSPTRQLAAWLVIDWLVYPPNQAIWVSALETYPTRQSTLSYLTEAAHTNPLWAEALKLLPNARSEPLLASWSMMRWALNDTMAQLFDPQFSADQIPLMLENLDRVALEILTQVR
jgi:multiple sugar transport system substrate-binding protein